MSKEVTVEELRERLEEIIAEVEAGKDVTVIRDGVRILNMQPTVVNRGVPYPFRGIDFGPRPKNLRSSSTDLLREDRDDELRKHGR